MSPKDFIIDQTKLIKLASDLVKNIEDQHVANGFLKRLAECGTDIRGRQQYVINPEMDMVTSGLQTQLLRLKE